MGKLSNPVRAGNIVERARIIILELLSGVVPKRDDPEHE